jgi:two-component system cell cycle sensor histidine kinase/response regulator CckA
VNQSAGAGVGKNLLAEGDRERRQRRPLYQEIIVRATVAVLVFAFNEIEGLGLSGYTNPVTRAVSLLGLAFNLPYFVAARTGWRPRLQAHVRILGDVALVTAGMYGVGGLAAAQYIGVYAIIPVYVGIVLSSRACIMASGAATASYLVVALFARGTGAPTAVVLPHAWRIIAFNLLVLNVVGVLTAFLSHAYRQSRRRTRASEGRFSAVAESAIDAIISADARGRILSWNKSAETMFGYAREEIVGQPLTRLMPEHSRAAHERELARYLATEQPRVIGRTVELEGLRKDGSEFPVDLALSSWRTEEGLFFSAIIRDITERKSLEEQLRQSQKMDAIGRLAGGVAHDFNNLLTAILGYGSLIGRGLPDGDPTRARAEEIVKAATCAASLTRQLLTLSRGQVLEPTVLNLNAVVADMENMLRRLIGEDIEVVTSFDPALSPVKADAGQMEQVFLNLAINARDAMPRGGRLTIETANVELDHTYARGHIDITPGPYVMLAVSDTGCGMDAETQSHIFEPFFTTKGLGQGTGLGLATVYGIVKQSGGAIGVYSEVGRGSTFKIYIPRVAGGVERRDPTRPVELARGSERILLVEDETTVRDLAASLLKASGYTMLEASDPSEALALLARGDEPIDLMLTDIVMPGMSGPDLASRLGGPRPEMKVLYISGYAGSHVTHDAALPPGSAFLPKPFTPEALTRKVREVLDQPARMLRPALDAPPFA